MTAPTGAQTWGFTTACVVAGALSVAPHAIATPTSAVVTGLVGFLGLRIWSWSRMTELVHPRAPRGTWRQMCEPLIWLALGVGVGLLLLGIIRILIEPALPAIGTRIALAGTLPLWRRGLIIYVAAVGEELVFRVVLLSAIAGLVVRALRLPSRTPGRGVMWMAIVLSALAFAAVHLPGRGHAMSPGVVVSVLALNAAGGIVLGYVFATRGLLAAILTHAGGDCALLLIGPLTG